MYNSTSWCLGFYLHGMFYNGDKMCDTNVHNKYTYVYAYM